MQRKILIIFSHWRYLLLAVSVFWVVFSVVLFFPHRDMLIQILSGDSFSIGQKGLFILNMYGLIKSNFTFFTALYTLLIALLFALNVTFMAWYIRKQQKLFARGDGGIVSVGIGGLVSGFLGIGCAACGTFVLTSVLALFGISASFAFLPLSGQELGILGVLLLSYSLYRIYKKIHAPMVCN